MAGIQPKLPQGTEIELWWQDEARIGRKNRMTCPWARRGTRPSASHDQRTMRADIVGAVCPTKGKGTGLVRSYGDVGSMNQRLEEMSAAVDPVPMPC